MGEQLFQIGIKAIVQNQAGELLLLAIPKWGDKPAHWDFPGGRMEPGESILQTLQRELQEEIGLEYSGEPQQLATVLSTITIPVGEARVPLMLITYKVELPQDAIIILDPNGVEQAYEWCSLQVAAERLQRKYPLEFCKQIGDIQ